MNNLLRPVLLTSLCFGIFAADHGVAQDDVTFSQQLPDRVAAWLHVADAEVLRSRFSESSWGRLMADPAVADFRADVLQKLGRADAAIPFPELISQVSGGFSVALMTPQDGKTDFAASIGFAEQDILDRLVRSIADRAKAGGRTVGETAHNSVTIHVITKNGDAPEAAEQAFAVRGQRLVASNSLSLLREILDRQDGTVTGSFATNARLQQVVSATTEEDRQPAAQWFLDPVGFLQGSLSGGNAALLATRIESLELARLQAVGGSIDFATGTYDTISRTVGLVESPVSGILGLLKFPVDALTIPGWVPNNVSGCVVLNWDADSGWLALRGLANELMGPGKFDRAITSLASDPKGPMIHIGNDVFGQLTGRLVVIQSPPATGSESQNGETLLAADLKDADAAQTLFDRLLNQESDRLSTRTIGATKVLSYSSKTGKVLQIALAGERLLVSESDALMTLVLTPNPTNITLNTSADYKALSAHLPGRSSIVGMQRSTEQLQAVYAVLQASDSTGVNAPDLKLLPAFDQIKHHFLPTATYATVAPNVSGFQYVSFTLAPQIEAE